MNRSLRMILCSLMILSTAMAQTKNNDALVSLIRGPYLQVATSVSINIRWRTDVANRSRVRYGLQPDALNLLQDDSTLNTEHNVKLSGLQPGTRYFYSVESFTGILQQGPDNFFYTLPETGKEALYRIGVFGDCGNNSVNQRNVKKAFLNYLDSSYLNAWILLGDNAYSSGTDGEFQSKFFNIYKDDLLKKYPLYPSPGNHDYNDKDFPGAVKKAQETHQTAYYQNFSMPVDGEAGGSPSHTQAFYAFNIGNIHFLSLDSYGMEDNQYRMYDTLGPQAAWVKKDLEENTNKGWIVAYWHHPPYTMGSHNSDEEEELVKIRENFIRILERYGVDLILCGHSHVYERSRLMSGHYGMENTFSAAANNLSSSSALYDQSTNSCPYIKDSTNAGTVYVVSGSAGQLGGREKSFPHDAMYYSNDSAGGACMLEVQGNRLDLKWVCADGKIRDHFTMMKSVNRQQVLHVKKGQPVTLTASFNGNYQWSVSKQTSKTITVKPVKKKTIYTVKDEQSCVRDSFTVLAE